MDSSSVVLPPYVAGPLRLEPFRGLMLTPSRIGDPSSARAFARPYRDVAARLSRWERRKHIWHDAEPAIYLHEYTAGGITVRGLVGALDVSHRAESPKDRAILPHEGIYPAQADDLADRMAEMRLNPAPILLVHQGSPRLRQLVADTAAGAPDHDFTDRADQRHRVWALRGRATLDLIAEELAPSRALIADGHHRYAAYLRLQQREPGGSADRGLAMLVDHDDTPLFLGAIHRVLVGTSMEAMAAAAATAGIDLEELPAERALDGLGPDHVVVTDARRWAVLTLSTPADRAAVEILHERVIPALPQGPRRIGYHHSAEDCLAQASPNDLAVLLPAPEVELVLRIAADDRLLPEKATSFQPKPSIGVLIRSLRDE